MKINEIILENQYDESWGQRLGQAWNTSMKGVGAIPGVAAGSWDAMKQGYEAGKAAVSGKPASGSAPRAQTQVAQPAATDDDLTQIKSLITKLSPEQKREISSELEKPASVPTANPAPTAQPAAAAPADPAQIRQQKQAAAAKIAQDQMAANPAPPAPAAGTKLTQQQQDKLKAKIKNQRAAKNTVASQTGSGFQNYVAGSGERMTGVDSSGAPVFQKIQRESNFHSGFLGMKI